MDLDLGSSVVFNVKVNGAEYKMSAPTVKQADIFHKAVNNDKGSEIDLFLKLVTDLGLPGDIAEKLDVVQLRKLSEGLLSSAEKK